MAPPGSDRQPLDDLAVCSIAESTLSRTTRISRTAISSVEGLGLSETFDASAIHNLENVLHAVERLNIQRCLFENIEEVREIAEGETFTVFECQYEGEAVAVKHVRLQKSANPGERDAFQRRLRSVLREISIMQHPPLAQHPNIINLVGYGWKMQDSRPAPYIVLELGPRGSLRSLLRSAKSLTSKMKMAFASDVASGLMALHCCGIVHGDLKLDNVIPCPDLDQPVGFVVKLCDFGHSLLLASDPDKQPKYCGTTLYNAPEVLHQNDKPIKASDLHKCDIWSYGLLVWEIFADGEVFFRRNWRHDPTYARSKTQHPPTEIAIEAGRTPKDPSELVESSTDFDQEGVLGLFDVKHLRSLAKQFIDDLAGFSSFEKTYLKPLFERTLQVDPKSRLSDLSALPNLGNSTTGKAALIARSSSRPVVYLGISQLSYDLFRRSDVVWGHQKQMLQDLEAASIQRRSDGQSSPAAFQTAMCYLNGFGTSRDYIKATQHLRRAMELGHPVANLIGEQILSVSAHLPRKDFQSYAAVAKSGFCSSRRMNCNDEVTVEEVHSAGVLEDRSTIDNPTTLADFSSLQGYLESSVPIALSSLRILQHSGNFCVNVLEAAIAFDDETLVRRVVTLLDVNEPGTWGETPLIQAARHGNPEILRVLLDAGADARKRTPFGSTVFHWLFCFVSSGKDILDTMFNQVKGIVGFLDLPSTSGEGIHPQWHLSILGTPLAVAISVGSLEAVQVLLEHGADPRAPAFCIDGELDWQKTPTHLAVQYHMPKILACMLEEAPKLGRDQHLERLPLFCFLSYATPAERYAVHGAHYFDRMRETVKMLAGQEHLTFPDGGNALLRAIDFEDLDAVRLLLQETPSLARTPFKDPTHPGVFIPPMHFAAHVGSLRDSQETISVMDHILAACPASIISRDSSGRTPLSIAATGITRRIPEFLLRNGAPVDATDDRGRTALHCCQFGCNVSLLLENKADPDLVDNDGFAPIHIAAKDALEEPLKVLLARGVNLKNSNNSIGTPLHCAVIKKSRMAILLLLENGANVDDWNDTRSTPLLLAIDSGRTDLAMLLLARGAQPFLTNKHGRSPFQAAVHSRSLAVLRMILRHDLSGLEPSYLGIILHEAARHAPVVLLDELIQHFTRNHLLGIDVLDQLQRTPLHTAALAARPDGVRLLIQAGASINRKDIHGNTPLLLACQSGPLDLAEHGGSRTSTCGVLLAAGASILSRNDACETPLTTALSKWDYPLVTYLIETAATRSSSSSALQRAPATIEIMLQSDPINQDILTRAFKSDEWDFITTCIAVGAISVYNIGQVFGQDKTESIQRLTDLAKRGNRTMVRLILMERGPEYARPPDLISRYFLAGLTGDLAANGQDFVYIYGDVQPNTAGAPQNAAFTVSFEGPTDPLNPKNWPNKKRWKITLLSSWYLFASLYASTMIAPGLPAIAREFGITSEVKVQLALSIFFLGIAIALPVSGPLSEIYGRYPVLLASNVIYTSFSLACGFATTQTQLFLFRFLTGLGGSVPLAIGGGVVGDLFRPEERGNAMGVHAMGPILAPVIGPLIGGWVVEKLTWRWVFWSFSIVNSVALLAFPFALHETYAPYILFQKAKLVRKDTGDFRWRAEGESDVARPAFKKLAATTSRLTTMVLTQPLIQLMILYMSISYGLLYLLITAFPAVFISQYGETTGVSGLNYLSLGLGQFIGAPVARKLSDKIYESSKRRDPRGSGNPEFSLPVTFLITLCVPFSLLIFGWSADKRLHLILPNIGAFLFGFGTMASFQFVTTYLVDTYTRFAGTAVAGVTIFRSIAGMGFPLFLPALINTLGLGKAFTVLAMIALGVQLVVIPVVWLCGERLRRSSSLANKPRVGAQDETQTSNLEAAEQVPPPYSPEKEQLLVGIVPEGV